MFSQIDLDNIDDELLERTHKALGEIIEEKHRRKQLRKVALGDGR